MKEKKCERDRGDPESCVEDANGRQGELYLHKDIEESCPTAAEQSDKLDCSVSFPPTFSVIHENLQEVTRS